MIQDTVKHSRFSKTYLFFTGGQCAHGELRFRIIEESLQFALHSSMPAHSPLGSVILGVVRARQSRPRPARRTGAGFATHKRAARAVPQQCRGVFRELLRLLHARGVRLFFRHLHRQGIINSCILDGTSWNDFSPCFVVEPACLFAMIFVCVPYEFGVSPPKYFSGCSPVQYS